MSKKNELMAALEAILFAMGEPVSLQVLTRALGTDLSTASKVVEDLKESYKKNDRGIHLIELDGSYQLCTKPQYYENLITVAAMPEKPVLTDTLLETLSIVAYRQPVTKAEISRIRGVSSDHAVSRLVEYGLIREAGRLNAPGRPMLFATTKEFLRRFGMDSLEQLPETPKMDQAADQKTAEPEKTEELEKIEVSSEDLEISEDLLKESEKMEEVPVPLEKMEVPDENSTEEEVEETEDLSEDSTDVDALMAELMGADQSVSSQSEMEQWVEELLESADLEEE